MTRSRDTANIIPTVDAKGDLIVGSADNTITNLAVGAEGAVLLADPSTPTGLAWGDAGGGATVSTTAPEDPSEGDLWFKSTNGTTYIYYDSFWVELPKQGEAGVDSVVAATAPITYDAGTQTVGIDRSQLASVSGNAIINGAFDFWQRGNSFSSSGFTADRWGAYIDGGTVTNSRQSFALGELPVSSFGEEQFFWRSAISGQSGAGHASFVSQKIEDVRTFAGQTVTISFWAKASSGTPKIGLEYAQNWGTGGSSSVTAAQHITAITINTSWTRYTATVAMPSISGKTLGTDQNSFLEFGFWLSSGSNFNTRSGSIGIQNNTFDIWGVQVEAGSTATPFKRNANSFQGELAACQRYCVVYGGNKIYERASLGATSTTTAANFSVVLPVEMRSVPTLAVSNVSHWQIVLLGLVGVAATGITLSSDESGTKLVALNVTFSSNNNFGSHKSVVLVGNNTLDAKIILSAEL
jgi:hypothetical protein